MRTNMLAANRPINDIGGTGRVQCTCNRSGCTGCRRAPADLSKLFGCTPAAVADVLDRAADVIHAEGFWQGNRYSESGHCVVTAVRVIAGYRLTEAAFQAFTAHLRLPVAEYATHSGACIAWNDTPGRTAAEVCGELRACAAGLRITCDSSGYRTVMGGAS